MDKAIWERLAPMFQELEQARNAREAREAKQDPLAHKMTRVFDHGSQFRYYTGGTNGKGQSVYFCYSVHRNAAGFFLGWREVHGRKTIKRDKWVSRRVKQRCIEIARRRAAAFISRNSIASAGEQ